MKTKANITNHKTNGVLIQFANGNSLSTIWGNGSYSMNHDVGEYGARIKNGSSDVEIMPDCSSKMIKKIEKIIGEEMDGSIAGYIPVDKWLKIVAVMNN
jgi:spore coat protein CotH